MPLKINGTEYYRTAEICNKVGISRSTFFRWIREGTIPDANMLDRRGWRLFTAADLENIKSEAYKVHPQTTKK